MQCRSRCDGVPRVVQLLGEGEDKWRGRGGGLPSEVQGRGVATMVDGAYMKYSTLKSQRMSPSFGFQLQFAATELTVNKEVSHI